MHEFTMRRRIEFADTDMGGIVHFSRYFVFMETAEHRFLNELGTSVTLEHEGRRVGWPRVSAACEYKSPARFEDEIAIHVRVRRVGTSSVTYEFSFRIGERETATGTMTSVCCLLEPGGEVRAIPIPAALAQALGGAR
jgi:4-hydroxybenzoyl-CoA thioesterase/acyl-CoA thioester hydrolase